MAASASLGVGLSERQKKTLNSAILEYLKDNGFPKAFGALQEEIGEEIPLGRMKLLERKWTAVVRLTKQVHDLKKKLEEKDEELREALPFAKGSDFINTADFEDTLPNAEKCHLKGHRKAINQVRFHPNTPWIASASDDGMVGIWDFEDREGSGRLVKWLKGHRESVTSVAFNKNGTFMASASNDTSIRIWNLEDEFRCIRTLTGHDNAVSSVLFARDSVDALYTCSRDGTIRLWEDVTTSAARNTRIVTAHGGEWVKAIALSLDASLLASASTDQTVQIWDAKELTLRCTLKGHSHVVESVAFSNINADEMICGRILRDELDDSAPLEPRHLASCSRDKAIIVWSIEKETALFTLKGHSNWVREVYFHPCGKFLLSCADDKSVIVWDLKRRRQETAIAAAHSSFVSSLDWNPALELLVTSSNARDLKVWYKSKRVFDSDLTSAVSTTSADY